MTEWLKSPFLESWFWTEVRDNLWRWLSDAPVILKAVFWTTTVLFAWLFVVGYLSKPKPIVRGTGVFLQLYGFILAAYGVERTLEKFGQNRSASRILPWIKKLRHIFVLRRKLAFRSEMTTHGESPEVSISIAEGSTPNPAHPSLAVRMDMLEWKIEELKEELRGEIEKLGKRIDTEVERLENKIEKEVEAVEEEVQDVREKVKEVNVGEGALWLDWCGVSFFVYGVPLASFPSSFLPAHRVLFVPLIAGTLLFSLHWYAD